MLIWMRQELLGEIDRISQTTDFAGIPLFGTAETIPPGFTPPELKDNIVLQIGHSSEETMDVGRYYMGSKELLLDKVSFRSGETAKRRWERLTRQLKRWLT